ncbi:Tyrosine-protein kinase ptk [Aquisphaera giovannonii]|uniref:Tyrosine-protein kinase ptk n=1 Tax=Aquisphaera giovannonii TaxID=406548 RepID=A0A5B9WB10_9BACT|nr:polysaccharide biosynthesis tyrosine autokinase [Aquisphaera giovannonii]QEH37858.1 Tyrosine-protein kinase ptk [Aquisphaera giovannonii]
MDPIKIWKAFCRRWKLALLGGIAMSLAAAAVVFFGMPLSKMTASALVHVSEKRPREIFETRESDVAYRTYQETQVILARSRAVIEAALKAPEMTSIPLLKAEPDPIAWLADQIKVDFPRGSEILTISLSASCDPEDVARMVNCVTDAYLTEIVEKERLERVARFDRLKSLFSDYQKQLAEKRREFKTMAGSVGTSDKQAAAVRQQMMAEQLGMARQELLKLQGEIRKEQARLNVLASRSDLAPSDGSASPRVSASPPSGMDLELAEMQDQLAKLKKKEADIKRIARRGAVDPAGRLVHQEIEALSKSIEARRRGTRGDAAARRSQAPGELSVGGVAENRYQEAQELLEILREQEKSLAVEIAQLESQSSALNVQSMDLHWLEDEIAVSSDTAKLVGSEVQSMTVEMQAPPRIRLIEKASAPKSAGHARRLKLTGMAGLAAFVGFLGTITFWELRRRKVDSPNDVACTVGLRIIGDLPRLQLGSRSDEGQEKKEHFVRSIDAVRTMLLRTSGFDSFQIVMTCSALEGEGKTSLSGHLATSLARAGRKTLLLDCDLRKPSLHKVFDVPPEPGLCEILRAEVNWKDAIHQTWSPNLSLMCAGRFDASIPELLPREQVAELFRAIRDEFDFAIVDTSPLLQVTDPLIVSQHVDAVLFSVLSEVSQLPEIQAALERLRSMRVRVLGAVVSGTRIKSRAYYGGYPTYG